MSQPETPFACSYTAGLPELIHDLGCTIAISTYQAGKVIFISAHQHNRLVQLPRTFDKPMGMAFNGSKLAIATRDQVVIYVNAPKMAVNYPKHPATYDALFVPQAIYYTGEVDIHDLAWDGDQLYAVNTQFSCLALIDADFSFKPTWKPAFISKVIPGDFCHLNGVAFHQGAFRFATALGTADTREGWRQNRLSGGVLIDVATTEIVLEHLPMPHSPRVYDEGTFLLLSATGILAKVEDNKMKPLLELDGFVRGMDRIGDYLFIGMSKTRASSNAFADLPVNRRQPFAGISVVHVPSMKLVGHLKYETTVEEIYDVRILPQMTRPNLIAHTSEDRGIAITTPSDDYWVVADKKPKG